jgi:hypothetical protein
MSQTAPGTLPDERLRDLRYPHRSVVTSYRSAETSEPVPFGVLLSRAPSGQARRMRSLVDVIAGVAVREDILVTRFEVADDAWLPGALMSVLTRGEIYARLEAPVTPTSGVHVRVHGPGIVGAFRPTAIDGATIDLSRLARWLEPGTESALLDFDLTNYRQADNGGYKLLTDNEGVPLTNNMGDLLYARAP